MMIVLYGADTFRSREKLHEIMEKFSREADPSRMNVEHIDALEIEFGAFKKALQTSPFLAKRRMIVFERLSENKGIAEEVAEFLKHTKDGGENVLVLWEEAFDEKKNPLAPIFKQAKIIQDFPLLSPKETLVWIRERVGRYGVTIDTATANILLEDVGNDLWAMSHEINKLVAYAGDEKIIRPHMAREMTAAKAREDIFGLVDAIGTKNKKLAAELLAEQWDAGSQPLYVLSMLARQYRVLLQVREFAGQSSEILAQKLKLHPFVVKKTMAQARKYSEADLKKTYASILEIDRTIKTAPIHPELLIEKFITSV